MSIPYFQIDAFAGSLFAGNPAGVCLLTGWLPDAVLQSIAAENNLAETAFLIQRDAAFDLRWFTPALEMDLCGHATLAAAHVIFRHLGFRASVARFQTRSGLLSVARNEDMLTLDFPALPAVPCEIPQELIDGLRARPAAAAKARDYVAVFETEEAVQSLQPDMTALLQLDASASSPPRPATAAISSPDSSRRARAFRKIR